MSKGAPEQIEPRTLGVYLEVMSKAVFQSGMSWAVIEKKWPGTQEAFRKFEPLAVASLTEAEIADLTTDTRIIRNRKKVEAVVDNARKMVELDEAHKGFRKYLRSHGGFEGTVKDLRKQFRFMGETGCYYFLYVVKEEVPDYDTWCESRGMAHAHADTPHVH
jgi:3-methyladenine DNA glycosylase Tag